MFKQSSFYRTDIWVGRYCGHPLVAWTHLPAALGMAAALYTHPDLELGWYAALFLLIPGCWLFMLGMLFMLRLTVRFVRPDLQELFSNGEPGALGWLVNREFAAFALLLALIVLSLPNPGARKFDRADFKQCVATLDPPAQAVLAQHANDGMTRYEFWRACQTARQANTPRPTSLKELQATPRR
jgi:hypothetical protein